MKPLLLIFVMHAMAHSGLSEDEFSKMCLEIEVGDTFAEVQKVFDSLGQERKLSPRTVKNGFRVFGFGNRKYFTDVYFTPALDGKLVVIIPILFFYDFEGTSFCIRSDKELEFELKRMAELIQGQEK